MKRLYCLFFAMLLVTTVHAITEQEAKQVVNEYYALVTKFSKTGDYTEDSGIFRKKLYSMFFHNEKILSEWIFNDIEYKINKRSLEKGVDIDTYIISMAGANLFRAQFTPSNIQTKKIGNEWLLDYSVHVYKQGIVNYTIPLQMLLDNTGKIKYIERYVKITEKIELISQYFFFKDISKVFHYEHNAQFYQNEVSYIYCGLRLWSNIEKDVHLLHKIYAPNGSLRTCSACENVPSGYTLTSDTHISAQISHNHSQGLGYDNGKSWMIGKYRWEIWMDNNLIGSQSFEILPPKPNTVDYLEITNVEFIGLDKNGTEITRPVKEGDILSANQKIKGIKIIFSYTELSEDLDIIVTCDITDKSLKDNIFTHHLSKNTTQDYIGIINNYLPQNNNIVFKFSAMRKDKTKPTPKTTYKYFVRIK